MLDETVEVSACCKSDTRQKYSAFSEEDVNYCKNCNQKCELTDVCSYCYGTGEVRKTEKVYENEPHTADIGRETCICQY